MGRFKLTPKAKADLESIGRYTQAQWGTKQRNKYLANLDARMHWLAENPQIGKDRDDIKPGYLSYREGRHIIFFRRKGEDIEIFGILHERMDLGRHL